MTLLMLGGLRLAGSEWPEMYGSVGDCVKIIQN